METIAEDTEFFSCDYIYRPSQNLEISNKCAFVASKCSLQHRKHIHVDWFDRQVDNEVCKYLTRPTVPSVIPCGDDEFKVKDLQASSVFKEAVLRQNEEQKLMTDNADEYFMAPDNEDHHCYLDEADISSDPSVFLEQSDKYYNHRSVDDIRNEAVLLEDVNICEIEMPTIENVCEDNSIIESVSQSTGVLHDIEKKYESENSCDDMCVAETAMYDTIPRHDENSKEKHENTIIVDDGFPIPTEKVNEVMSSHLYEGNEEDICKCSNYAENSTEEHSVLADEHIVSTSRTLSPESKSCDNNLADIHRYAQDMNGSEVFTSTDNDLCRDINPDHQQGANRKLERKCDLCNLDLYDATQLNLASIQSENCIEADVSSDNVRPDLSSVTAMNLEVIRLSSEHDFNNLQKITTVHGEDISEMFSQNKCDNESVECNETIYKKETNNIIKDKDDCGRTKLTASLPIADYTLSGFEKINSCVKPKLEQWNSLHRHVNMEQQIKHLRSELHEKALVVQRLQTTLYDQQVRANMAMMSLRTTMRKKDAAHTRLRDEHERRMSTLLSHLLYLEGQMRLEHRQVVETLHEKDDIIRQQKLAFENLASRNKKLLVALRESHSNNVSNGGGPFATSGLASIREVSVRSSPLESRSPLGTTCNDSMNQKVRFTFDKDKLRRHKSSMDLYRPSSLETLFESPKRGTSQALLLQEAEDENSTSRLRSEIESSDHSMKSPNGLMTPCVERANEEEQCCFPHRLTNLLETHQEVDSQGHKVYAVGDNIQPCEHSNKWLVNGFEGSLIKPFNDLKSTVCIASCSQSQLSLNTSCHVCSGDNESSMSRQAPGRSRPYGQLAKSLSLPQSLSGVSTLDWLEKMDSRNRPHSLPEAQLSVSACTVANLPNTDTDVFFTDTANGGDKKRKQQLKSSSDTSRFKSFKNVFRRRSNNQRNKKRADSLKEGKSQECDLALRNDLRKYDIL